jgi:hypothetical protein
MNSFGAAIIRVIVVAATVTQVASMATVHPLLLAKPKSNPEFKICAAPVLGRKTEEQMDHRVKEFFLQYEKANSSSDTSVISAQYADTFMFGGPNGVQAVNKGDFLKVVPKRKAYFSSMGLSETKLDSVQASPIDSKYLIAKVAWTMRLQNTFGSKTLNTFATHVLARGNGDELSIVFQIDHQDLGSVVKTLQSAPQ